MAKDLARAALEVKRGRYSFQENEETDAERSMKSGSLLLLFGIRLNTVSQENVLAYHMAIEEFKPDVVEEAVQNFIKGNARDFDPKNFPKPGQLAKECRRIVRRDTPTVHRPYPEETFIKEGTPESRLEFINRVRAEHGQEPFNEYEAVNRHRPKGKRWFDDEIKKASDVTPSSSLLESPMVGGED